MSSTPLSVILNWSAQEPGFRHYLSNMSDDSLLRLSRCLWWEAIRRGEPLGFHDQQQLTITRQECERRELAHEFDRLEGELRAELRNKGLLPGQRIVDKQA